MAPPSLILSRRDLDFYLYEWLDVERLTERERHSEHSRETFDAVLDLCEVLATRHFAPHNKRNDIEEPRFVDGRVVMHPEVGEALHVFAESGLIGATMDAEVGGMQLPYVVASAATAWFSAANIATMAYPFLSTANANLLLAHGSEEQVRTWVLPIVEGRFFGTMCLSEPQAGSSLADVSTRAVPQEDGTYRLFGNKMWISGGDHELSENIVHLVLARVAGAQAGVKGLSLFIVPKYLVGGDGTLGERNDVVLAGLNHKMGYRGTVNTLLNFGEGVHTPAGRAGAVGYLVGDADRGLSYMFHMMNEARIGVGMGAATLGYTGYLHALEYARTRTQGRPLLDRDPTSTQIPLTGHADVRRMLLAQKSYVEGAMALILYCAQLVDRMATTDDEAEREGARELLDMLTPIAKSWPSQWCLAANDLAIQVHGGYGYTREYNVEQFYRDNRLNPIHEGTHGIQGLDLLGRKAIANGGSALRALIGQMVATAQEASALGGEAAQHGAALTSAAMRLGATTGAVWADRDPELALANATAYLEAAGHIVVAWMWLQQLIAVGERQGAFYDGKRAVARYFYRYELPKVGPQLDLLESLDRTTLDLDPDVL